MIHPSAISEVARAFRRHLVSELETSENQVLIGHPASTSEINNDASGVHYVNLFFYHLEHTGYPVDAGKDDPTYVKLHCLVTAFGKEEFDADSGQKISAGEMDLRLLGKVVEAVHKSPIMNVYADSGEDDPNLVAELQIVPIQMTLDDINKIWSTQHDTSYRPSVAFELALVPVPLAERISKDQKVGAIGIEVFPSNKPVPLPQGGFDIPVRTPTMPRIVIDLENPDWEPHICLVDNKGTGHYFLSYNENEVPDKITIAGAGKPDDVVDLIWQLWEKDLGWRRLDKETTLTLQDSVIDPYNVGPGTKFDWPEKSHGQLMIYAERKSSVSKGSANGVKSNILLVTIYKEDSP